MNPLIGRVCTIPGANGKFIICAVELGSEQGPRAMEHRVDGSILELSRDRWSTWFLLLLDENGRLVHAVTDTVQVER